MYMMICSGKSTFLNVLAERLGGQRAVYEMNTDLQKTKSPASVSDVAFIHQDDQFFSMLTVEETLKLAAALRLQSTPKHTENVASLVDDVMQALSLKHVAKSFVGDPTKRGISGGERKRLAVASELLGNPSLLLADEPTSGLDAFQAYGIMSYLSSLAKQKKMSVVCAIHQPRSSIWGLFDDILLLASGRLIYMGPREEVIPYFAKLG